MLNNINLVKIKDKNTNICQREVKINNTKSYF